jgi:choline dehydrogenase-like flavoprotein
VIPGFGPQLLHSRLELDRTWGRAIHESTSRLVGHAFDWFVTVEDLPQEANEVLLDPTLTDGAGIPAPRIRYRVPETAEAALEFAVARAIEAHEAAGAVETRVARVHADCGWHLLGTARIGSSPETSVCDPYGRVHDVPNLFVADGSVFVTAGAVNPTATICAFALRCAEHIAAGAGLQETPA